MDETDGSELRLVKIVDDKSKHTNEGRGATVNLSPSPVFERMKRLEASGYIKKYIAVLNAEKFNQGFIVFCNIRLKQHEKNIGHMFVADILCIEEVVECYNVS